MGRGSFSVREDATAGSTEVGRVGVTATGSCGALSYGLSGTGSGLFTVAAVSGGNDDAKITVAGSLDHETRASYSLRLTVSSGSASGAGDVSIGVRDVNERPVRVGTISGRTIEAGSAETVEVSGKFRDPDGDVLRYAAASTDTLVARVTVSGSGVVVSGEGRGSATVRVTATDPGRLSAVQSFRVTVPNRAPVVEPPIGRQRLEEGDSIRFDLDRHFWDYDGDDLSYGAGSSDSGVASVRLVGSELTVRGVAAGSATVTLEADDGHGGTATQGFEVVVVVTNRAPVFASGSVERSVAENAGAGTAVGAPVTATDGDGDELSYSLAAGEDAGSFAIDASTGQITVGSGTVLDYESGDSVYTVRVVASDGSLADTAAVTIRVTDEPAPGRPAAPGLLPVRAGLAVTWEEPANGGPEIGSYDLQYRKKGAGSETEVSVGLVLTHTIANVEPGATYEVQVRAVNAEGGGPWSEAAEVVIRRAPEFEAAAAERSVAENAGAGTAVGAPVTAFDADGEALAYSFVAGGDAGLFAVGTSTGQITVGAGTALDYESGETRYAVRVAASDGSLADTVRVTIRVTDEPAPGVPAAPEVRGATGRIEVSWRVPGNEGPAVENYDLRYREKDAQAWADSVSVGTALSHVIGGLPEGTAHEVQVRAESAEGRSAWSESGEGTTNHAPAFEADAVERPVRENAAAGEAVGEAVAARDEDGNALAYSFAGGGDAGLFAIGTSSGQITVGSGTVLDYESGTTSYAVRVVASDGELADTAAVTIRVTDEPAPGRAVIGSTAAVREGLEVWWRGPEPHEGSSITGYHLHYRERGAELWTEISPGLVDRHTIIEVKGHKTYEVEVRAESAEGLGPWSATARRAIERAPYFDPDTVSRSVRENLSWGKVGDPVTATDPDGDELTHFLLRGTEFFMFTSESNGQLKVRGSAPDYESGDTVFVVYLVATDFPRRDTATVTIRITDVPPPAAPEAPGVTARNDSIVATWTEPDDRGAWIRNFDVQYREKDGGGPWTEVSVGDTLSYTIGPREEGTVYEVQVRAESREGKGDWSESGEGPSAVNSAPAFTEAAFERAVEENAAAGAAVGDPVTASDADGQALSYGFAAAGSTPPFEIDASTGQIAVAAGAALDYESGDTLYTVRVEASDGELADTATVTIRVADVVVPGRLEAPDVDGGRTWIDVSWSESENGGVPITGYEAQRRVKDSGERWGEIPLLERTWFRLSNLPNKTTYEVQVRAVNVEGPGLWSESGEGTTNRVPAFGSESFERAVAENAAAGTAVGDAVAATDEDEDTLSYGFAAGGDEGRFDLDASTGQITVASGTSLDYESGDTIYTVHMVANDGLWADTAAVTIRIADVPVPGRPAAPVVSGDRFIHVAWRPPERDSAGITTYWLRYRLKDAGRNWRELRLTTPRFEGDITPDEDGTYEVQVQAWNVEGPSEWSESGDATTNLAPAFGSDALERSVAENAAAGTAVGEPVTASDADGDTVSYRAVGGSGAGLFDLDASTGRIAVGTGTSLDYESGDTLYTVRVVASDGLWADTATVTIRVTDVPVPGRVAAPAVAGGSSGIDVTWSPPEHDAAGITTYWMRYRLKDSGRNWRELRLTEPRFQAHLSTDEDGTYEVQIQAWNIEGPSAWSESGEARTNRAPAFAADGMERSVAENAAAGTAAGDPVTAEDADGDTVSYRVVGGSGEGLFEIGARTGRITVAGGAALDYEGGDTVQTVLVEASDGMAADTATVAIRITNADDPGMITLNANVARVGMRLTATLRDEDGSKEAGKRRQWRISQDGGATWVDIAGATTRFYTPVAGDEGKLLRAVFTYTDGHGPGKRAESAAVRVTATNEAPAFSPDTFAREVAEHSEAGTGVGEAVTATDGNDDVLTYRFIAGPEDAPFTIDAETGQIGVAGALNYESGDTLFALRVEASDGMLADTAAVTIRVTDVDDPGEVTLDAAIARVGMAITASLSDEDGPLEEGLGRQWQRSADDGASWTNIAGAGGEEYIPVAADEGNLLRAVFTYADGHGPGKRAVSEGVRVTGTNQAPRFDPDSFEREVAENSPAATPAGAPVTATDDNRDALAYRFLAGAEDAPFDIDAETGQISVADALDYESGDTLHALSVEASDGMLADTAAVTIRITDADDPGVVTLDAAVARLGMAITAALTDQDGPVEEGLARQWQRLVGGGTVWSDIKGASAASYTPVFADAGLQLRAVFTYADGHGPGKRAESEDVRVTYENAAPAFPSDTADRSVPENSAAGTPVGDPVTATDPNDDVLDYAFVAGADEALFAIVASTGQIEVAPGAALDYEGGDTIHTVRVEASDGKRAATVVVTVRVTDADDPGVVTLDAGAARVGTAMGATLMDQDGSLEQGKRRRWRLSDDGGASWANIAGATTRLYTPVAGDEGKLLRSVFTYTDGHGPGKRAESAAVPVVGASTPAVSFGSGRYTVSPGGSVDVTVRLSPAATSALDIEVVLGGSAEAATHTVTFETGYGERTLPVSAAGLSAHDTIEVAFGTLPAGVVAGVPAEAAVVVTEAAGDAADPGEDLIPLAVEFAETAYTAHAGSAGTEVTVRVSPAADREVTVPVTATGAGGHAVRHEDYAIPASLLFEPGDSLRAFTVQAPPGAPSGTLALGFGALPEAVSQGTTAAAAVDIVGTDAGRAPFDQSLDVGLAVFGRAVAEGARQAVGGRFDAVMRPGAPHASGSPSGYAGNWTARATGVLGSLTGAPVNGGGDANREIRLPTGKEAADRLLPQISFSTALGAQTPGSAPRFSLWGQGSAQGFRGKPGGVDYDGGLRALTLGADARIGASALLGLSVMRSGGDFNFSRQSIKGSLGHTMNTVIPYLFLQPSPSIGLWTMAGYGSGSVEDQTNRRTLETSLRMVSGGLRIPLARSGPFALALATDAFGVRMRTGDHENQGTATRARALLEASYAAAGLKLATHAGARYDGGDADVGAGSETGASIAYAGNGLDLALNGRLATGADGHREWGAGLRLAWDPGSRGEGLRLALNPNRGHHNSALRALLDNGRLQSAPLRASQPHAWRLDAEAGYGIPQLDNRSLDAYSRLSSLGPTRSWTLGTSYHIDHSLKLRLEGLRNLNPQNAPNTQLRLGIDLSF